MNNLKSFITQIDIYDYKKYVYHVIYYPSNIIDTFVFEKSRCRAKIMLDGLLLDVGIIPDTIGSEQTKHLLDSSYSGLYNVGEKIWYSIISKVNLKKIGKEKGDSVIILIIDSYLNEGK